MVCRRLSLTRTAVAFAGCLAAGTAYAQRETMTQTDLFRQLLPTVVNIAARGLPQATAGTMAASKGGDAGERIHRVVGSGFIVGADGVIVTNEHVVDGASQITVTFSDGTNAPATLIAATRIADLALLRVHVGQALPVVTWGDSDKVELGDPVVAIGNPLGIGMSISSGIVSAKNRDIMESPYDDFIQTDAAINHGNSGGPLFNMRGEVIGIDSALISPTSGSAGLGFAFPARNAQFVIDRLMRYGWVHPGWIGTKVQQVTPELADALGLHEVEGSIVAAVEHGSPADRAGLQVGDVLLKLGDTAPSDERALLRAIATSDIGTPTTVTVLRGQSQLTLPITVAEWPRDRWDKIDAPVRLEPATLTIAPDLGLKLEALQRPVRGPAGTDPSPAGVLVTGVASDTDAAERGLVAGDVLLRVQESSVATPDAVWSGISEARQENRKYVAILVLPKVQEVPGPKWIVLQIAR